MFHWEKGVADHLVDLGGDIRLLIDSGAFTAWKKNKEIHVKDYAAWIKTLPIIPWRYFALDVVGNALKTQKNLNWMYAQGMKPTPVFQRGEDWSRLQEYHQASDLVGIGLGVGSTGYKNYLREVMKHTDEIPVHWLGVTQPAWIAYYKPFSVDGSSWTAARQYGQMRLYDRGKFYGYARAKAQEPPSKKVRSLIRRYGFDPAIFAKEESWHGHDSFAALVTVRSWMTYAREAERRFGTKLFLGAVTAEVMEQLVDAWKWCEENEATI
tara:strand:+ start:99 stop:899 length:801 start_codon:yes stop_codon:yes gene_type:complete